MVVAIVTNKMEGISKPGGDNAGLMDEPDEPDDDLNSDEWYIYILFRYFV